MSVRRPALPVERTPYGTWRARWRDNGRSRARSFPRKADAVAFLNEQLADIQRGHTANAGGLTVEAWADQWLTGARNLGQGGRDTYRRDLDRYILPALGAVPLDQLTDDRVDRFLTDELDRLAPSTVHRHYRTIRRMMQVAVERKRIRSNPCDPITPPRLEHTEMRFLTGGDVDKLAETISPRYRAWVLTAAWAGPRWSELVGLRRSNLDDTRLTITEQLIRRADGDWHRDPPKTRAGRRTINLPGFLADELSDHLKKYAEAGSDGLVFPNQRGAPMIGSTFTGNVFKPALDRAGLDRAVRIHDLRHTAVALAIQAGAHPKAIQHRMGHASITVTLDRYGHLFPEIDEQLAVALDRLHSPDVGTEPPGEQ